jgi:hypothetical protein
VKTPLIKNSNSQSISVSEKLEENSSNKIFSVSKSLTPIAASV